MEIKEVAYGSEIYELAKGLREEVLRRPLGLDFIGVDLSEEKRQIHIVAVDQGGAVVGTVLLIPLNEGRIKLRQMAISPALQGKGAGRKVIEFAESIAKSRNFHTIEMHARLYARGFYEKLGYKAEGDEFIEVTIPHVKMTKALQ
ncbi:MAG: GNAT family N-acetyltransferase [Candidatus Obscuribacterales bacterium]|jgi:predicted GNAT family N-acyltransferase|nr:GNAT family N-acetyltransferase [Candidatus Obscuribacterales bacterium]